MPADNDNGGDARDQAKRMDRLITVIESQTNAINRLVQVIEDKRRSRAKGVDTRMRRTAPNKVIAATPLVQAAVDRALRKAGHK